MSGLTPSQTIGPYFRIGLDWPDAAALVDAERTPSAITLLGRVLDGDGAPVPDGLIEIWQADAAGHYQAQASASFRGLGRAALDADGGYRFVTVKPGCVPAPDGSLQAPHINLTLFARGLLVHLRTRVYFADESAANAEDPVLALVAPARRATLIATPEGRQYRFDIHLQGAQETVFFDV